MSVAPKSRAARPRRTPAAPGPAREPRHSWAGRLTAGGTDGNELLTTYVGVVLFAMLAVLGVTILRIHQLLWLHLFLGLLLIGPVALKMASTGYRFARYYTNNPVYKRKGPPVAYLRMLAPVVVLSTVVVFASGVALLLLGPGSRSTLLLVHKASFIVWVGATALHVLGHAPDLQRTLGQNRAVRSAVFAVGGGDERENYTRSAGASRDLAAGRAGRALSLAVAVAAGLALALALIPQFGPWLNYHRTFVGH